MAKKEKKENKEAKKEKGTSKPKRVLNRIKNEVKAKPFEERPDLEPLYILTIVVEKGVADTVLKLLQNFGSSAQFIHMGRGTAPSEILSVLSATIDKKAIINAFVGEDKLKNINEELDIFFKASRANRGIAFSIPLASIQGIRMYKYLTQTF